MCYWILSMQASDLEGEAARDAQGLEDVSLHFVGRCGCQGQRGDSLEGLCLQR